MKAGYINNNKYQKPFPKRLGENIIYNSRWIINKLKKGKEARTILFYPQYPSRRSVIYKVLQTLNYNITNNPAKKHHLAIYWENTTYREPDETINALIADNFVINQNCRDISKSTVEKIFKDVFDYSYAIDPKTHEGPLVKKNEVNAYHDGAIVMGPVEPEPGFVYQKLINNNYDNELVIDIRVPVFNGKIPFVYKKYKPNSSRFTPYRKSKHKRKKAELKTPDQLFSNTEIKNILSFTEKIRLDYGELDILRDADDKKIYIIDVNNTPYGPPSFGKKLKKEVLQGLGNLFEREFIHSTPSH